LSRNCGMRDRSIGNRILTNTLHKIFTTCHGRFAYVVGDTTLGGVLDPWPDRFGEC
jgi:hypothetical protein